MASKLLALRRPNTCRSCSTALPVGAQAWWDTTAKRVECSTCRSGLTDDHRLSAHLHTTLGAQAVVLDQRRLPGSRTCVDHVVVAPSGVWVIEGQSGGGRVQRRDRGGWFKMDERLLVAGKDRTTLVDGLDRHVAAIEGLLAQTGLSTVPVHAALCFLNSEWGRWAKPFALSGVWVTWPEKLTELVLDWKAIPDADFDSTARAVAARLSA